MITYEVTKMPGDIIIGRRGESRAKSFKVDCRQWLEKYPGGSIAVTYNYPGDDKAWPLPYSQAYVEDGYCVITVKKNMTSIAGTGRLNIRLVSDNGTPDDAGDDHEKRSAFVRTTVLDGPPSEMEEAPDIVRDWVNDATIKINEAVASTRYLHIKYSVTRPESDEDMTDSPSAWIGLCHTDTEEDPSSYLEYRWTPLR